MPVVYDKFALFYDSLFRPFERWFFSGWRAETLAFLPEHARILELGSGTGLNFRFYPESTQSVSSELSAGMLTVARTRTTSNVLVQADAQELPFDANAFDAAFATLVFCSIPDPMKAFAEVRRVVKPSGSLVLLEHVRPKGFKGRLFDMLNVATVALIDDHFNRRTAESAASAGFKVVEVREKLFGIFNLIVCEVLEPPAVAGG